MKYEKSAYSAGVSCLAWAVGILLVLGALQIFWATPSERPWVPTVQCWLLGLIPVAVCGWTGVRLIRNGGSWKISVDHDGISWFSPDESVNRSFQFALEDLDRVETRISRAGSRTTVQYVLVPCSGEERTLGLRGWVDQKQVIDELEMLGVPHEIVRGKKRRKSERAKLNQREFDLAADKQTAYHA